MLHHVISPTAAAVLVVVLGAVSTAAGQAPCPPAVDTLPVQEEDVFANAVIARALVYPDCPAEVWFEYGIDTSYGNSTLPVPIEGGNEPMPVAATLQPLQAGTLYHFRAIASNSEETVTGENQTFATDTYFWSPGPPAPDSLVGAGLVFADFTANDTADLAIAGILLSAPAGQRVKLMGYVDETLANFGYAESFSQMPGVYRGSLTVGDYDNDGRIDLAGAGDINTIYRAILKRNVATNGNNWTFTDVSNSIPPGPRAADFGDFDNDGDLDLAVADAYSGKIRIYRSSNGSFDQVAVEFAAPGVGATRTLGWGDYDNDGDLDLLGTSLYRNDNGTFIVGRSAGGGAQWADYDADGDLDIISFFVSGDPKYGYTTIGVLQRNDGNNIFTLIGLPVTPKHGAQVAPADFDNDGLLDLAICGSDVESHDGIGHYSGAATRVWRNSLNNPGAFLDSGAALPGVMDGAVAWGDYDANGTLDLATCGRTVSDTPSTRVFENLVASNTPPSVPANPITSIECDRVIFSWDASGDTETPSATLTYNMRVGTTPDGFEIMSPHADPVTGARRLWEMGNVQLGTDAWLRLPAGTYYWAVQAVDNGYLGSPFSEEQSFTLPSITTVDITEVVRPASDQFLVRFVSCPGNNYIAQKSMDLSDPDGWFDLGEAAETAPGEFEFLDTEATGEQGFYRLRLP